MERPLLSIVVPTKNRYFYLKYLIKLVDSFKSSSIELLIHDNSDDNKEIKGFLEEKSYPNVRYVYTTDALSMSGNSNKAVELSSGEFVCFVGDDDAVCSNIVDCAKWMKSNNIDAVVPLTIGYEWPDAIPSTKFLDYRGKVISAPYKGGIYAVDPLRELSKAVNNGFTTMERMPRTYQAIVRRSVLDQVYSIGNTFFPGASPDIANAVSLCFVAKNVKYVDFPIVISGASKHLGGDMRLKKGRRAEIDKLSFLPKCTKENWEKSIPCVWTGITVWADSAIKALRYSKHEEYVGKVKLEKMYARFIAYYPDMRSLVYSLPNVNKKKVQMLAIWRIVCRYFNALINAITLPFGFLINKEVISDNVNIIEAVSRVEQLNSFSFKR